MRTLRLNSEKLWRVSVTGFTDEVDVDGNFTGEILATYSVPDVVRLSLYPTIGRIRQDFSGIITDEEYVAVTTIYALLENDLLFRVEPSGEYELTHDFKVSKRLVSKNTTLYLLNEKR